MVSYITRTNYGAIISEMENATNISRSLLSMSLTGSFITYGIGQLVSGVLGDRFSPKKLILTGLIITVCANILIPFCHSPYMMLAVWCVNGFAQSFMWPPMVKLLVQFLSSEGYKRACAKISYGSSAGTIVLYLISPLIISLLNWKAVFIFSAICGFIAIFVWQMLCPEPEFTPVVKEKSPKTKPTTSILFMPTMIAIMIAIILQGMLRDGVATWMPTYISDIYNVDSVISILSGVVLPIFSIICFKAATSLYIHKFRNPVVCGGVFFCTGTVSAIAISLFSGHSSVVSVLSFAVLTGAMHGTNLMLICMIPPFFEKSGNISTVSGLLNSCTYIGSAISTYAIALVSEKLGWNFTVIMWCCIAGLGAIICFIVAKPLIRKLIKYA